jgi:hypothetical protein
MKKPSEEVGKESKIKVAIVFLSFLFILPLVSSCSTNQDCTEQPNGYCNILGECHYCPEGEYYSLGYAGCIECTSDSECTAQSNGYCDVLKKCTYCLEGQFYSRKLYQCSYCDSENPCTEQPNGYCNILGECNYCPEGQYYRHTRCVECSSDSECTAQSNGVCNVLGNCVYSLPQCIESDWTYSISPNLCPPNQQQTRIWTKIGQCSGGFTKPSSEIISCVYNAPECTYTYSDWSLCDPSGIQTRTYTSSPENCQGNPIKTRKCTPDDLNDFPPTDDENSGDDNVEKPITLNPCLGCKIEEKCFPLGFRKQGEFCSEEGNKFRAQKSTDSSCENSFECISNLCIDEKCVSGSLFNKILEFFRRLFGG